MLHLGIKQLQYEVEFDSSCYYPLDLTEDLTFKEERRHLKVLFGASFGWWWNNSVSIARRPSETKFDKIDLFGYTYRNGISSEEYAGSIDIDKKYILKLTFEKKNTVYRIEAFTKDENKRVVNFLTHYSYPIMNIGWTVKRTQGDKIFIEKNH